jgi:membrane protein DedA with SNARE-associated domain
MTRLRLAALLWLPLFSLLLWQMGTFTREHWRLILGLGLLYLVCLFGSLWLWWHAGKSPQSFWVWCHSSFHF